MSSENETPASVSTTGSETTTKSGRTAPASPTDAEWKERQAKRKAAKRAEKKWYSEPLSMVTAAVSVVVAVFVASGFVSLVENGNGLAEALQLAGVNAQGDVERATIGDDDGPSATLIWSDDLDRAVLSASSLDELEEGGSYHVWLVRGGTATDAGTLSFSSGGHETWTVLDGDISTASSVIVTAETDTDPAAPGDDVVFTFRP